MCHVFSSKFTLRTKDTTRVADRRKLKKIFKELANRCESQYVDRDQFLRFTGLPGLLGEQIFNALDEDEDNKLDVKEFVIGISTLYAGQVNSVTDFLFKLFNFSRNGQITRIDVDCILEYMPEKCGKCQECIKPSWNIHDKIEELFGNEKNLFYEQFHEKIIEKNEIGEVVSMGVISLMPEIFLAIFVPRYHVEVLIEGNLQFRNREYYAKLKNKAIFYSISHNSQAKGIILVNDLFIESNGECGFVLKNSKFSYEFTAESMEMQIKWIEKLRSISDYRDIKAEYEISKETIGKGAYGKVKLARKLDSPIDELFAVKIISKEPLDPRSETRLRREISILKICNHENILKLKEIFEDSKKLYIVTEFIPDGTLFSWLKKRGFRIPEELVKMFISQIASAVKYLHSFGIFHRDIKLENILIDNTKGFKLKIIDFGLGCILGPGQFSQEAVGTLKYASPELISRIPYRETPDVWGIGVIIYIILTGRAPFYGKTDQEIANQILKKKIHIDNEKWSGVSDEAKEVVLKLLTRKPSDRMNLEGLFSHRWFSDLNSLNINDYV